MKTPLFALTALFFLLAAMACQKKPAASFSTNKEVYSSREQVRLSNASTGAYYYSWIVKGPAQEEIRSSEENFSFDLKQVGTYKISLSVYAKNGKEVSKVEKTIESRTAISSYVFYTDVLDGSTYKNVSIYIDNQYVGNIGVNCYYTPTCGTPNTITKDIPDGNHDLRFNFGPYNINQIYNNVPFSSGQTCRPYQVY